MEISQNISGQTNSSLIPTSPSGDILTNLYAGATYAWNSIQLVWGTVDMAKGLINDMVKAIPIGGEALWWVTAALITMITVTVALEIISMVTKYKV
jgi:TRAP-type C4-dicarboxylate transport system permease small subunit